MPNPYFRFKQFTVYHDLCAMKVNTDGVLLGSWAVAATKVERILDIGTGSGLIALMLAQRYQTARITAIDIDADAAKQASLNFEASGWSERLQAQHISIQNFGINTEMNYDLIVSNPPFFSNSLKNPKQARSIARHTDTLSHKELLFYAKKLLCEGGSLCIILPFANIEEVCNQANIVGFYLAQKTLLFSKPSISAKRVLLRFSTHSTILTDDSITIETTGRHIYSDEYKELTKDFYL